MTTLLPGVIFPPISYCIILQQQQCEIDGFGYYHKQSIRNHFQILSANGRLVLTLPIQSVKGQLTALHHVQIENGNWHKPMMTAIQSAYGKSPFFFYFKEELAHLLSGLPGKNLYQAQLEILKWLCPYLGIAMPPTTVNWEQQASELAYDFRKMKKKWEIFSPIQSYHQVFMDRFEFAQDLSVLDLLFNLGPQAKTYIAQHPPIRLVLEDHQNS